MMSETIAHEMLAIFFLFNVATLFTILGFLSEWPKKVLFHLLGMFFFFALAFMFLANPGNFAVPSSLTFFMLGGINLLLFLISGVQALGSYKEAKWE